MHYLQHPDPQCLLEIKLKTSLNSSENNRIRSTIWIPRSRRIPPPANLRLVLHSEVKLMIDDLPYTPRIFRIFPRDPADHSDSLNNRIMVAVIEPILEFQTGVVFLTFDHSAYIIQVSAGWLFTEYVEPFV